LSYTFSLEVLLNYKKRLENEARVLFNEAQTKVEEAIAVLGEYYDQVDRTREESLNLTRAGGILAPKLISNSDFISGQKIRIEAQRLKIRELKTTADELHESMIEAAKETKTLEKLKERGLEAYKKDRRKSEMKKTDELVTLRHKPNGGA
jgi:flagellar FliJ protein